MRALFFLLLLPFIDTKLKADIGTCAIYQCNFKIGGKASISGYIQIAGFDMLPDNNNGLLNYLKEHQFGRSNYSLNVYSKIQTIEYPKYEWSDNIIYSAVAIEDTQIINISEIHSIKIIKMTSCECLKTDERGQFIYSEDDFLINYYHHLINDINQQEIDLLNTRKPIHQYVISIDKTDIDAVYALNYNTELNEADFREFVDRLKFEKDENQTWEEYGKLVKEHYQKVREVLRRSGIILINIFSYT